MILQKRTLISEQPNKISNNSINKIFKKALEYELKKASCDDISKLFLEQVKADGLKLKI